MERAFLGVGLIGGGLAEASLSRGESVRVWNRTVAKTDRLVALGAAAFGSPAEACRGADIIHVTLSDDAAVDAVLEALGTELRLGRLIVDHTTTSPVGTRARAARLAKLGTEFLHAPVFMSPKMARAAGGLMLAAGPASVFERASPLLATMTGKLEYLGERPDLAAAQKLFGNAMIFSITAGLADILTMAKALDVSTSVVEQLFQTFNPATTLSNRGVAMAKGEYVPGFELTMARKDARLMLESAGGLPLAILPAIAARMDDLISRGHGSDDMGVLAIDAVARKE